MSELPWENKKIADIMSAAGDEAKLSDSGNDSNDGVSPPPIPDILANAFADIPMEEANIEVPDSDSQGNEKPVNEMNAPPFGDLPDLSAIAGNTGSEVSMDAADNPAPADLPPFMQSSEQDDVPEVSDEKTPDMVSPFFNQNSKDILPPDKPINEDKVSKKYSPPPLFEPQLPQDEEEYPFSGSDTPPFQQTEETSPRAFADEMNEGDELNTTTANNPFESMAGGAQNTLEPQVADNPFISGPSADKAPHPTEIPSSDANDPFSTASDASPETFAPEGEGVDPFSPPGKGSQNPFAPPMTENVDTPSPAGIDNPFESQKGTNPLSAPSKDEINPFDTSVSESSNPFEAPSMDGTNPFGEPLRNSAGSDKVNDSDSNISIKQSINVDDLKNNLKGLSTVAKGFLKNLTKGKSLIERMEEIREDRITRDFNDLNEPDNEFSGSPFDTGSEASELRKKGPFQAPAKEAMPFSEGSSVNPFEGCEHEVEDDIRRVTPVDTSPSLDQDISGMPADDKKFSSNSSEDPVISEDMPGFEDNMFSDEKDDHDVESVSSANGSQEVPSSSNMELSKTFLSREIKDIKSANYSKFEGFESDIGDLRNGLNDISMRFDSICSEIENFSGKVSEMDDNISSFVNSSEKSLSENKATIAGLQEKINVAEGKMNSFESSISVLQSDKESIRSDISQIEDNVSELVNSYTALLTQLHESLQANESQISRIDELESKIDDLNTKIASIERLQEESISASTEFSRSVSSIVDNLGNVSSEFDNFKQESEQKNTAMLEKIDSVTEYMESELKKLGARSYKGFGQNVHLSHIAKNSSNMKLCMEWLEFLMELAGRNNLSDILSYYEELGWITEEVRMELLNYAEGIDFYMEKPDWKLTPDDHVKSIWFIESLAGMKVDKNRLSVIERDIEKVKQGSEIYGI